MKLEVDPNPPAVGPSHLTILLTDAAGQPVAGSQLKIEGTMAHAGMQPRLAQAKAGTNGKYEAPFVWSMGGDWNLTVTTTLADGQEVKQQFDLTVKDEMALDSHQDTPARVPNQGAIIRIVSPQPEAIIEPGQKLKIEVETANFELGANGNHWHVLVDGQSPRMIMGAMNETTLSDLEPGRHEISAYLSNGKHEELAEGATVVVTVAGAEGEGMRMSMGESEDEPGYGHAHQN